jgi:hypothetical protein
MGKNFFACILGRRQSEVPSRRAILYPISAGDFDDTLRRLLAMFAIMLAAFLYAPSAQAQQPRTWISSHGDDANPCSIIAPCRTFMGTMNKTAAGGEIDVLDPNGGGTFSVFKSITIDGGNGQGANVTANLVNGVVINAGTVILRNLRINGIGTGLDGITIKATAKVLIENCEIYGFASNGIVIDISTGTAQVVINNTRVFGNGQGGIQIKPTGGTTTVSLRDVLISGNGFGIGLDTSGGGTGSVMVERTNASENTGNGIQVTGTGAVLQINNSEIQHNATGVNIASNSDVRSFQNNVIAQNGTTNVVGTLTKTTPQ